MNLYETFRNDFLLHGSAELTPDELNKALKVLDRIAPKYEINSAETALALPDLNDTPELVKLYIAVKKTEGVSDNTLDNYFRCLNNFFMGVRKAPGEITAMDIRLYLYNYEQQKQVSKRSLEQYRGYIDQFYTWCMREGSLSSNPCENVAEIKYEQKQRESLTAYELELLRKACITPRESAIVEVLYSTGARVSELTGLKKSDVDFLDSSVHLFGKGKKHRTSYLTPRATIALKDYLNTRTDDNEYLFISSKAPYTELTSKAVEKIINKISARANLTKTCTPHILRHTAATMMAKADTPVQNIQRFLGHESPATTMIYIEMDDNTVRRAHEKSLA